ncbi:MAG: histidine phosphatase family protein [Phaeodactylibacter sp.]|nr:histidine phosphatase family protein [Phaeodactylibacter sp.]
MTATKEIYIIRHGETELNRLNIVQGSGVDAALNEKGHQQARAFFEAYRDHGFEAVLTSRLRRTHETAMPFIETGLPWEQFEEINEISWGEHEGQEPGPAMRKAYSRVVDSWTRGDFDACIPGGESAAEMAERLSRFVAHLRERPEQKILVCSHGRAMRCLMCLLRDQPLQKMDQYHHSNTGLYKVRHTEGLFHFELFNDTTHLEGINP